MGTRSRLEPAAAVGVAASAGGVEALTAFVRALPGDFSGVVLVVLHLSDTGPSVLPHILGRVTPLKVLPATDAMPLRAGTVVVAPPGKHLLVADASVVLDAGPRQNGHRPSADVLFRSLAESYGQRAAGVVLSGTMDDGAAGLRAIRQAQGLTIAQDPAEAAFPGMPRAAIAEGQPTVVCRAGEMAEKLTAWMAELGPVEVGADPPTGVRRRGARIMPTSQLTEFTCPECGGSLWLDRTYGTEHYRCRVGHAYSPNGLLAGKHDAIESALWAAIVAIGERADISDRLLTRLEGTSNLSALQQYRDDVSQAQDRIDVLRDLINELVDRGPLSGVEDGNEGNGIDGTTT